jgi:hypothetical protein
MKCREANISFTIKTQKSDITASTAGREERVVFSFLFFIGTKDPYYIQPTEYNTDSKGRYVNEEGRYFDGANWREL